MVHISNNTNYLNEMYYQNEESNLTMMQIDTEPRTVSSLDNDMSQLQQKIADLQVDPNFEMRRFHEDTSELIIYSQHMDIREPLSTLKRLLERKLNFDLNNYQIWLMDIQVLEKHQILADPCFLTTSRGLVKINVRINRTQKKIIIVDVLKPVEHYI